MASSWQSRPPGVSKVKTLGANLEARPLEGYPPRSDARSEIGIWSLGITRLHSVKGSPKLVYALDTVASFLRTAFNSVSEPLELLRAPHANDGEAIDDLSLAVITGMGRSAACRMIAEVALRSTCHAREVSGYARSLVPMFWSCCT